MNKTLKKIRKDNDLTQKELADMLGVSRSCVANWEAGTREADISILKKYNELFGYKIEMAKAFAATKCELLQYLDISMLNDAGITEIKKIYSEVIKNPKYLKNS